MAVGKSLTGGPCGNADLLYSLLLIYLFNGFFYGCYILMPKIPQFRYQQPLFLVEWIMQWKQITFVQETNLWTLLNEMDGKVHLCLPT